jgi:hypothetical protein
MILDKRTEFASALALNTGAPATFNIGDVLDLGSARDIGNGEDLWWYFRMITAATSGGAATLNAQLVTDDNAGMASPTVIADSGALALTSLTAGSVVMLIAVPLIRVPERYLGIRQITGTAAFTGGTFSSGLVLDPVKWLAIADGVN